jgi:hypothetical protein
MSKRISAIRYADLWALLRRLGNEYEIVHDGAHRVWEHQPSGSRFTLAERPPDQLVYEETLFLVRLQLDNFGVMTRDEFDRWAKRRAKANAANGTNGTKRTRQPRASEPRA